MRVLTTCLSLALLTSACSSATRARGTTVADKGARKATAKNARGLVRELYTSVRRGRGANMQTLLSDDAYAIGPAAVDVHATRGAIVVAATSRFEIADRHRVTSRGLITASSPSGQSAWIADRVDVDRTRYTLVAVLAQIDEIWYAQAVHLGRIASNTPPESLPALPGGVAGGAEEAVDLVRAGAADPAMYLEQLAEHSDATVLGPGKHDYARGKRRIARLWKKRKLAGTPIEIDGEVRARITPDGALAWVAANSRASDGTARRIFWIYERSDDGWRLVLMQWAAPQKI